MVLSLFEVGSTLSLSDSEAFFYTLRASSSSPVLATYKDLSEKEIYRAKMKAYGDNQGLLRSF